MKKKTKIILILALLLILGFALTSLANNNRSRNLAGIEENSICEFCNKPIEEVIERIEGARTDAVGYDCKECSSESFHYRDLTLSRRTLQCENKCSYEFIESLADEYTCRPVK